MKYMHTPFEGARKILSLDMDENGIISSAAIFEAFKECGCSVDVFLSNLRKKGWATLYDAQGREVSGVPNVFGGITVKLTEEGLRERQEQKEREGAEPAGMPMR